MEKYELTKLAKHRKTDNVRTLANLIDLHDDAPDKIPAPLKKFTRQQCVAMLLREVIDLHRGEVIVNGIRQTPITQSGDF